MRTRPSEHRLSVWQENALMIILGVSIAIILALVAAGVL